MWLFVLFHLGMLAFLAMTVTTTLLVVALPTLDFSAWYGSSIIAGLIFFFSLAIYAFYRSVAWKGGLADALGGD